MSDSGCTLLVEACVLSVACQQMPLYFPRVRSPLSSLSGSRKLDERSVTFSKASGHFELLVALLTWICAQLR